MKYVITLLAVQQLCDTVAFQRPLHTNNLRCKQLSLKPKLGPSSPHNQRVKTIQYAVSCCNKETENLERSHSSQTTKSPASAAASSLSTDNRPFRIFCDLDGVLCDFDAGVRVLSQGRSANSLPVDLKWGLIAKADRFYERLPWTADGRRLWQAIRPHCPNILTGVSDEKTCPIEKAKWCARELGVATIHVDKASATNYEHVVVKGQPQDDVVNIITCWSTNKHYESGERAVLIDDRIALAASWRAKGGIFIHHTNAERTLDQLRHHGIIPEEKSFE